MNNMSLNPNLSDLGQAVVQALLKNTCRGTGRCKAMNRSVWIVIKPWIYENNSSLKNQGLRCTSNPIE
jgi:hypothetical protein